jgi:hypothetical protein
MRTQHGTIKRIGRSWYGRWREDVIEKGQIVRKQRVEKLCDVDDRYRTKGDVSPLLAEKLQALNEGRTDARSSLTLATFVAEFYDPYARQSFKPSTVHGYSKLGMTLFVPELVRFGFAISKQLTRRTCLQHLRAQDGVGVRSNMRSPC